MTRIVVDRDSPVTIELIDKSTGDVVHTDTTPAELLGGALTRLSYTFNADISGGVRWRHPRTGQLYPRGLSIRATVIHPETNEPVEVDVR